MKSYEIPEGLYYTKEHEWAKVVSDKEVIVGITSYAAEQLHDIVFVELPELGKEVLQGRTACTVESVKSTADVMSPFSGRVVRVNEELNTHPELVNMEPYGKGWFFIVQPEKLDMEKGNLMSAEEYRKFLKSITGE